jgi:hypothetical protein
MQENIDFQINSKRMIFNSSNDRYYYLPSNVEVITSLEEFKILLEANEKVCYIERSPVVNVWLEDSTREYIEENLIIYPKNYKNYKLYLKNNEFLK